MQQLHDAQEVHASSEVPQPETRVKESELELAIQLIEQSVSDKFRPEKLAEASGSAPAKAAPRRAAAKSARKRASQ